MKLYWRVKINGKWTYKAAQLVGHEQLGDGTMAALVKELKE